MNIEEQFAALMKPLMDLDTTKWADQLLGTLAKTNVPGIDMDAFVASRREDLNALAAANNQAMEGMKSIMAAQKKIMEDLAQGAKNSAEHVASGAGSPKKAVAGQLDLAKESFEQATENMRALAEAVIEANRLTMRPIIERIPDAMEDAKDVIKAG